MITDHSGISVEYILIFKKPVLFVNSSGKINNEDYKALNIESLENQIRNLFGYQIEVKNIGNIASFIENAINQGIPEKSITLDEFTKKNFYNFGFAKDEIIKFLIN